MRRAIGSIIAVAALQFCLSGCLPWSRTASFKDPSVAPAAGQHHAAHGPDDQMLSSRAGIASAYPQQGPRPQSGTAHRSAGAPGGAPAPVVTGRTGATNSYAQCRANCIENSARKLACTEHCTCRLQCAAHSDALSCEAFCALPP